MSRTIRKFDIGVVSGELLEFYDNKHSIYFVVDITEKDNVLIVKMLGIHKPKRYSKRKIKNRALYTIRFVLNEAIKQHQKT